MQNTAAPKLPPGPEGNVLLNRELDLRNDLLTYLERNIRRFDGISRNKVGFNYYVNISKPEYIEHVFMNRDIYIKGRDTRNLMFLIGNGLLTSGGDFWMKQRKLIQPIFHKQRLNNFVEQMTACVSELTTRWEAQNLTKIEAHAEMTSVTLEIVSRTLMSTKVEGDFQKLSHALEIVMEGMLGKTRSLIKTPYWVPLPKHIRMKRHRRILDETVNSIISKRRNNQKGFNDLLSMLLEVEDAETAERMSDEQLRDEVITIFLAGHETSANAMSFALYLLAKHPDVAQKIRQEVKSIAPDGALSFERINKLEYTTMVVKESMRLYPPAWAMTREAAKDDVIDGYLIRKGDSVVMCAYAVQRYEKYWQNPTAFIPERFSAENLKSIHRYAYFPFGGGARLCIGNNFAMMEMQIILAMLCSRYDFVLPENYEVEVQPLVTLRPKNGVPLLLKKVSE